MIGLFASVWGRWRLGARPAGGFADKGNLTCLHTFPAYCCCYSPRWLSGLAHLGTGADYWHSGTGPHRSGVHITNRDLSSIVCIRMRVTGSPPGCDQLLYRGAPRGR